MSVIHLVIGLGIMAVFWATKLVPYQQPDKEFIKDVTLPSFLHAFGHCLTNVSFAAVAVSFTHTVKSARLTCALNSPCAPTARASRSRLPPLPQQPSSPSSPPSAPTSPRAPSTRSRCTLPSSPSCSVGASPPGPSRPRPACPQHPPSRPFAKPIRPRSTRAGVALASATELSFTWIGFTTAMASNAAFAGRAIFSKNLMKRMSRASGSALHPRSAPPRRPARRANLPQPAPPRHLIRSPGSSLPQRSTSTTG